MDRPGVRQVPEGSGEQGKIEKTGCKIICNAPATLAVKGLMMMMMMKLNSSIFDQLIVMLLTNTIYSLNSYLLSVCFFKCIHLLICG